MSVVTIKMCDVENCRLEASEQLSYFISYYQEDEQGGKIVIRPDVDLCGAHYYKYKTSLPDTKIERKS